MLHDIQTGLDGSNDDSPLSLLSSSLHITNFNCISIQIITWAQET